MSQKRDNCTTACIGNGGKGNAGFFRDWNPRILAAGVRSPDEEPRVKDLLSWYSFQDEVDALVSDAILPPVQHPKDVLLKDTSGTVAELLNPEMENKTKTLTDNLKNTVYRSFWNDDVGQVRDPTPGLPAGMDIYKTTFGKTLPQDEPLYDIVMPKDRFIDVVKSCRFENRIDRKYSSHFDPNLTYGERKFVNRNGIGVKRALTNCDVVDGRNNVVADKKMADYLLEHGSFVGEVTGDASKVPQKKLKPTSDNFVEFKQVMSTEEYNPDRSYLFEAFENLNRTRKVLSKVHSKKDFTDYFRIMRHFDKEGSGWLPKDKVYEVLGSKRIYLNRKIIEDLLRGWSALKDDRIEYSVLLQALNSSVPITALPNIRDFDPERLNYESTYQAMVAPGQKTDDRPVAGLPYTPFPKEYCRAHKVFLPDEGTVKGRIYPANLTHFRVTHRDYYQARSPEEIRKLLSDADMTFSDEEFEKIWNMAKGYHSRGLVCLETFKRTMNKLRGKCTCKNTALDLAYFK